jgi:hypothetical protein
MENISILIYFHKLFEIFLYKKNIKYMFYSENYFGTKPKKLLFGTGWNETYSIISFQIKYLYYRFHI